MSKVTSAGIIVKHHDQYVIGHVTGQSHFDIFKGRSESGESFYQTAIRECIEESSLDFSKKNLTFLGLFPYTKKKNLALFVGRHDQFDINELHCSTYMDSGKLEMDYFELVTFDEMIEKTSKSMSQLLKSLESYIRYETIPEPTATVFTTRWTD